MTNEPQRTWWIGVGEEGEPLFLQAAPEADVVAEQRRLSGDAWHEVSPLLFYRTLVAHMQRSPEREEAYLEAMEETLEQWERAGDD